MAFGIKSYYRFTLNDILGKISRNHILTIKLMQYAYQTAAFIYCNYYILLHLYYSVKW